MLHVCLAAALAAAAWTSELANDPRVLVTGATGRTGSALYLQLKARRTARVLLRARESEPTPCKRRSSPQGLTALSRRRQADSRIAEVRALVRNVTKARELLGCKACDESEGVFVGDVTKPETLTAASTGIDTVAIAAAVGERF